MAETVFERDTWTVGEVEAVCWRLRAAGATDETRLTLSAREVRAEGVVEPFQAVAAPSRLAVWAGHGIVLAVLVPVALRLIIEVWGWAL